MPHHALPSPTLLSSGPEATVAPAWGSERPVAPVCAAKWRLCTELRAYLSQTRRPLPACIRPGPGTLRPSGALIRPSLIKSGSSGGHHPSLAPHGLRSPRGARKSDRIPISGAPTPGRPGSLQRLPRSGPIPARSALSPSSPDSWDCGHQPGCPSNAWLCWPPSPCGTHVLPWILNEWEQKTPEEFLNITTPHPHPHCCCSNYYCY